MPSFAVHIGTEVLFSALITESEAVVGLPGVQLLDGLFRFKHLQVKLKKCCQFL